MTRIARTHRLTPAELDAVRQPRGDLLIEVPDGRDAWVQEVGPFASYRRTLLVDPDQASDADTIEVREKIEYKLAIPFWGVLFRPFVSKALVDLDRRPRGRWWWPSAEVVTEQTARLIAVVAVISIAAGYLGVLIGQTITFAAKEFGASDGTQGRTLAAIRIGILLSLLLIGRADRTGRKPLLIGFAAASIILTSLGALAQGMVSLGITQALARGLATGLLTLVTLAVTEEVPAGVRSLSVGLITLSTGMGGAIMVMLLPLADLSIGAWRITYLVPLTFLPVLWWAWGQLPETRRFDASVAAASAADTDTLPVTINRKHFWMLGTAAFASTIFLSPASQLLNEYLNDELDFSATDISLFRLLVTSPVALFILGAGYLADRTGRRPVAAIGIAFGASASAALFFVDGAALWILAMAGSWLTAGAYAAMRSYQTELFPTRARARIGGWLDVFAVSGSAVGLLVVSALADRWGRLGPGIALMLVGPLVVLMLIIFVYPETAQASLEELNPDDPAL
ncbi:MAG: MFS family permease [Acidimicrobiales bacterium]